MEVIEKGGNNYLIPDRILFERDFFLMFIFIASLLECMAEEVFKA